MIAAIILAAGRGHRFGRTKQLMPWGETTILGATINQVALAKVDEIVVVTGHDAAAITAIASAYHLPTVQNPDYVNGEMLSSLKVGVQALTDPVAAALVILADQPFIPYTVINQLIAAFKAGAGQLIAPVFQGQRGNPVLIGRPFFAELLALPANSAPRALLQRHPDQVALVEVETELILLDIDRVEQYERLRPR
ncbi:MAG: nucleotidyltransferase family protein [Anaerolineae bacterium]|nr:nucleotidyltransferase family protein [Anaerolineae bacterium]